MQKMSLVFFTAPSHEVSRTIIHELVENGLIACGTIIPQCTSIYRWQEHVEEHTESQSILKVAANLCDHVVARIHDMHPYDVPEIIVMPVSGGLPAYINWVVGTPSA